MDMADPGKELSREVAQFAASGAPRSIDQVAELKVSLAGYRPPIWRRIRLPVTATLADPHQVIQVLFGWNGSEYGLTQDEMYAAIEDGKLQYQPSSMHGNPWLRLLRREVEDLVSTGRGDRYLKEQKARTELARINRELKQLRAQIAALEERKAALLADP